jgi:hypothetical protein
VSEATVVGRQAQTLVSTGPVVIAPAASLAANAHPVARFSRLTAVFHLAPGGAPAAGFPRVVQSINGVSDDLATPATQDVAQLPEVVYTVDVQLSAPYVKIEFTDGGAGCTLSYAAMGRP